MSTAAWEDRPLEGAALEAARAALIPRIRRCDLDALSEFFALTGGTVIAVGEPVFED